MLLILWRAAWMDHKLKLPPGRIRRIAAPKQYVSAWTPAQIEQLLAVASRAEGRFKRHQVQRAAFWRAFILTGYYSALRVGDLLRLTWSEVRGDAIVTVQHKTGDPIVCRLPPDCLAAMQAIHSIDRPRVFGDLLCRKRVLKGFAALVRQAGLSGGTKMLRRTSATAVDGAGRFFAPNT
jgi:integrase